MPKFQNAENDVKVAQAYVTIEENKVREAEAAHDQVVEAVRQQENQVNCSGIFWSMLAQNELNQAKAPISNDENVLNQAFVGAKPSRAKYSRILRVISRPCKRVSRMGLTQWLKLRVIFNSPKRDSQT